MADLADYFDGSEKNPGWLEVEWSKPTGSELEKVIEHLKGLKLTFRNVPVGAKPLHGKCIFTGKKSVERILIGRAY